IYGRLTDGGRTWARTDIDPGYQEYPRHPVIAADPNSDRLYVLWHGSPENENLPLKFDDKDRADVFLRVSTNGGRSWSERQRVNDEDRANHAHPGISIAPNGRVDIAWYDGRLSPKPPVNVGDEAGLQDVYMTSSTDGGRTFGPSVRMTDRSIDRSIGVWSNNVNSAAPVGITSTDDVVYVAWQDTRNGDPLTQAEDVYVASARLGPDRSTPAEGTPRWLLAAAGVAAGMAVAMLAVLLVRRA
ncbi:MAG: glycoside hydrolase, partial [Actinomycetota bacterium]|nr:glycoside hydrolase [Actinomycetota bacterium]